MKAKKKIIAAISAAACVVCVAVVVGLCIWQPWAGDDADGSAGDKESASEEQAGNVSPLHLSSWSDFETYWEEVDDPNAAYSETDSNGNTLYYNLKDGFQAGEGIEDNTLLLFAEQISADTDWDMAVVDCSTGDVSRWKLAQEVLDKLSSADNLDLLEEQGVIPYEGKWVTYSNIPQADESQNTQAEYDGLVQWSTHEETCEELVEFFEADIEAVSRAKIVSIALTDDLLMEMLVEEFGQDVIDEYMDEANAIKERRAS